MYIIKNALRNVRRMKGRFLLIGIIICVIVFSACVGLSIRHAAELTKEEGLSNLKITATITPDMENLMSGSTGKREDMREKMNSLVTPTLEELKKYGKSDSVKSFNYSLNTSLDGSDKFESMSTDQGDIGGKNPDSLKGDFNITGFSSDSGMTMFTDGLATITDGEMFKEGGTSKDIVISSELADYNKVKVGDKITLVSPEDETKKVTFTIKGVYESNEVDEDENVMSMGNYNRIYISYNALDKVCDLLGIEGKIAGEYSFDSVANYEKFESEVKDLGLSDDFTVKSDDITSFEKSIEPLDNLSKFAGVFLILVLGIGSIVLIGINIYGIRERKYEVGVLTAMGMKKHKVAMQFITETVVIALLAIIIGTSIGLISAKPITNNLLANQTITATEEENFGRKMGPEGGGMNRSGTKDVEQIKEVNMDVDSVVIIEVLLIGLLVSVIASGGAIGFITKYEPLSILADRD